jgi:tRNA(Ile)-lysidine synthase
MHSNLVKKFKDFLWRERLFVGGEKIIIGISGGADSVCLVELLSAVQNKFGLRLQLVHINYHLRGKASDEDEQFVKEYAQKNSLELEVVNYIEGNNKQQKVEKISGGNLEEKLREFRYEAFERIRREKKFDWIAVGHHQDDQVETFLLNLFRGAGGKGLSGMKIKDEQRKLLRPLLNFSKQEIVEFLQSIKWDWREDKSNQDDNFLRNKIRHQLIPKIEAEYSPQFKQRISDTTRQLQEYQTIIQDVVNKNYSEVVGKKNDLKFTLNIPKYKKLSVELKPLIFRQIIQNLKGNLKNITNANYQEFQKIIQSTKGKKQKMHFGEIRIDNNKKEVIFSIKNR